MSESDKKVKVPPLVGGVRPRRRVYAPSGGDKMTQQCHALDTNIHAILGRFRTSGQIPHTKEVHYGEQPDADFQEAMFSSARLKSAYEQLPDDERSQTTYADFLAGLAGRQEGDNSPSTPAEQTAVLDDESKTDEDASPSAESASKNSERDSTPGAKNQLPT